ncbi:MlaD family protein [Oricola sp.]|uniref:MlaD family protein n=1 Tax=Oricola sp. TaxID=1979950 RepID=UPI003BA9994A
METKANYVTVGAFTLLIIAAAFSFVYWVARVGTTGESARLDVVIEGSVTGLGVGSFVKFNGIDVGKVTRLRFDASNPKVVIAKTVVNRNLPISRSTKAVLGFTGLTGIAHIEFEGGDIQSPNMFEVAEANGTVATITADPSAVNNLLATAQDIFDRTDRVLSELEGFATEARGPLNETLNNAATFSQALSDNSDRIDEFLKGVGDVGAALAEVSGKLDGTLTGIENLIVAVEPEKVATIVANVESFSTDLGDVSARFSSMTETVASVVDDLGDVGQRVDGTFDRVDAILDALPPEQLSTTLTEIAAASGTARQTLDEIAAMTEGLGGRNQDIQAIIDRLETISTDAQTFMANASDASGEFGAVASNASKLLADLESVGSRVEGSFDRVDALLDAVPAEQVTTAFRDLTAAGESARRSLTEVETLTAGLGERQEDIQSFISNADELAQRLNAASVRVDGILQKVDTILGSDEGETLLVDAQQTLRSFREVAENLNNSITSISSNLERFSDQGLRDVQGLVNDTRRSVSRIETAISDLERNPQRLIFGGQGDVKTFDGRQRR